MENLKNELSKLGEIEVLKNDYVFTLLMKTPKASKLILKVMGLVTEYITDKPNIEVIKNDEDYILIILKP